MRRWISVDELRLGMFVRRLDGPWYAHPFWRSRFELNDASDLERLRACGIARVEIDEALGLQLASPATVSAGPSAAAAIGSAPPPVTPARLREPAALRDPLSPRERSAELRRANATIARSRTAVMSMFADARLGKAVKAKKLMPLVDSITRSVDRDPAILLNVARLKRKDEYTYLHSVAVCALMISLARTLRLPEDQVQQLGLAGLLHDVGKMGVDEAILAKPGKLDDAEFAAIRNHPEIGHRLLADAADVPDVARDVCLHHHERMDGTGYPHRLPGEMISMAARMGAICDVYDAVTSQRPYNRPWSPSRALALMPGWTGHFDQLLLASFTQSLGILPQGTRVVLADGSHAEVVGESASDVTLPRLCRLDAVSAGAFPPESFDAHRSGPLSIAAIISPPSAG